MSLEYIRNLYKVPAYRGSRVIIFSGEYGTITGSRNAYLLIKVDGEKRSKPFHPTWNIDYIMRSKIERR